MSVSSADPVQDVLEPIALPISTQDHATAHEQPADVSFPSDKRSSESVLGIPQEDASNGDVSGNAEPPNSSAELGDAANGHPPRADAVAEVITAHSNENVETQLDNATDAPDTLLGSVPTASDSLADENLADSNTAATAETASIKEPDNAPAVVVIDSATTAEHQEPSTSDSVTVLAEESLADKTINDSAIEIPPSALEEEKDHGVADKPDVEAVEPAIGGESAVVVEDSHEETNHTHINVEDVEEAKDVVPVESEDAVVAEADSLPKEDCDTGSMTEAQEVPKAAADEETGAAEQVEIDQVLEEQPRAEATPEVLVAEADEPEGCSGAVGGVEQDETAHEAEPVAAEINNVGDGTHEAVENDELRTTVAVEGGEVTLEQLDEQPEVTVHVETAPFVEEPQADEVVVATTVEQVGDAAAPAEGQAVEEVRGEVVEDIPAAVEAVAGESRESQASVVSEEPAEVAIEESPASVDAEIASEETSAPIEAGPAEVAIEAAKEPVTEEVASASVEAEAASEEPPVPSGAGVSTVETSVSVGAEPVVETAREKTAVAEPAVAAPGEVVEPTVEVATNEETPVSVKADEETHVVEAEPVIQVTTTEKTPAPIEPEPVATEAEIAAQIAGREADAKPTSDISREDAPAPVEAVLITSETAPADTEPTTEATEEVAPIAGEPSQDAPAPIEAKPTPETVNEETLTTAIESEPIVSEEAPGPAPIDAGLVTEVANEDAIEVTAPAETANEEAPDSESVAEAAAEIANEAVPVEASTDQVAEVSGGEVAPAETQEVPCENISVEAEGPVGVAQEEIAVKGAPAAVDLTASSTEDILGHVADAEPEVAVEADIKNDTEVTFEDTSVALATTAIEEPSPAIPSESMKEPNVEAVLEEQPATENKHLSADVLEPPIKKDIPAEDAVGAERLTGLKTEALYIQTSLDTSPFTPIVDSGIELKEYESQPPRLLSIAEEIERPKSPWSSSFQVTTIGRGELPGEDMDETFQDVQFESKAVEFADAIAAAPLVLAVEDVAAKEEAPVTVVSVDSEPWTPSYSVHSQGTVTQATAEHLEDDPTADEHYADEVIAPAETLALEPQDEPDVNVAEESEIQVEEGNEQVHEATTIQEISVKEDIDVVSADITEPRKEESATTIALADEDANQAAENEQGAIDTLVDPLESSVKTWTPSYLVHAQGTSTELEKAVIPEASSESLETETLPMSQEPSVKLPTLTISTESIKSTVLEAPAESWTPSYAVHSQGSPSITPAEVDEAAEFESIVDKQPGETWTPSYSVHSQGSPMVSAKEIDEASEPETPEPLAESWTPSYSIHSQGTPLVTPKDLEETPVPDVEPLEVSAAVESTGSTAFQDPWTSPLVSKEIAAESQNNETVHTTTDEQVDQNIEMTLTAALAPIIAIAAVETAAATLAAVGESEQSTKHWTPSYSIHSQGSPLLTPVILEDEHPTDANDHTDEPEVQNSNTQEQETPDVKHSATAEIDVTSSVDKTTLPVLSVSTGDTALNSGPNHATSDVPERHWTPSYLVTQQGSGLSHQDEDKTESQPVAKASVSNDLEPQLNEVQEPNTVQLRPGYSVSEDLARDEKFMLFGLRAIVAYLWVLPKWLSTTRSSSEGGHSRQDSSSSSSSSKFFPGGWFTPKPNEGRTSLDVAQGEFTPSTKVTTTTDMFETLNVENGAGASTRTIIDGEGADGQKRRWCVVM